MGVGGGGGLTIEKDFEKELIHLNFVFQNSSLYQYFGIEGGINTADTRCCYLIWISIPDIVLIPQFHVDISRYPHDMLRDNNNCY